MTIRTRFAPSPTGMLHLGGVRTALYAWLLARHHGGEFVLRVEDTDQERSTKPAIDAILAGMKWLGLDFDGKVVYQTSRLDIYKKSVDELLEKDLAYRCTCSQERLHALREEQLSNKQKPKYDGHCRELNLAHTDQPHVIRFKTPLDGEVSWCDLVHGKITINNSELDDLVIMRGNGMPTYNFAVVVDDADMEITHVVRGDDHINNTPRQLHIFKALNKPIPKFAHLPMILGKDRKKLSKRDAACDVMEYQKQGFLKEAVLNYLVRLGWSHKDQEIFSVEELINLFDITDVHAKACVFDTEKLNWLNQHYLKTLPTSVIEQRLEFHLELAKLHLTNQPPLSELIPVIAPRVKTLQEFVVAIRFFYEDVTEFSYEAKTYLSSDSKATLLAVHDYLQQLEIWEVAELKQGIKDLLEKLSLKMPQLAKPLRVAITGSLNSPDIATTLYLLGKQKVLQRILSAIKLIA
ncbi:MAG: glutamate--tRNA ligase [Thiotrichales bacterium]|nr:MAG: glutamate--tRNA ligase [Thiotrichales bacterium]